MNQGYSYPDRVVPSDAGVTVAAFYSRRYLHFTEAEWRRRIEAGQVLLNGRPAAAGTVLARGDSLVYRRPPWDEPAAPTDFGVLYEDDDLIVLNKPSGLPVLPGGLFLENTLLHLVRARCGAGLSPVHRLGRGTSGAILFARNAAAARSLSSAMAERRVTKIYLALASGAGTPETFTVDAPIGPVPHRRPATVNAFSPDGRPSLSLVRVLRRLPGEDAVVVEVTIPTGRPHQIRIHLSYAGHPLVGDPLYEKGGLPRAGGLDDDRSATPGATGYLLHSWKIRFPHPAGTGEVEVVCPPPTALAARL